MNAVLSWGDLCIYLAVFLVAYYLLILLLFYRKEIPALFSGKAMSPSGNRLDVPAEKRKAQDADSGIFPAVHELMEDCKTVFHAAISQGLDKEQILAALQVRIERYPQVRGTSFQVAITNHIEQELQHRCGITLQEPDLSTLWK